MSKKPQAQDTYPPIEDYGLIGDCHSAALVGSRGSLDWLCLPRFDSPSIFARILDLERGGAWSIHPTARFHAEHRYLENTNVLETVFTGERGKVRLLDFMPVSAGTTEGTSESSHAIVRIVEVVEGEAEVESVCSPRPEYGQRSPDLEARGSEAAFGRYALAGPGEWEVDEAGGTLSCRIALRSGESAGFVLRHDARGDGSVVPVGDPRAALQKTVDFWRSWADRCTYRGPYRDAVVRSALALKLLTYAPTGAIVAAPTTSLPEEIGGIRNWDYRFTWIRDASFTLYALLLAGYAEEDDGGFNRSVQHGRFWVLFGSGVREWRGWVVREGCPRHAGRSCGSGGRPGRPSATSPQGTEEAPRLHPRDTQGPRRDRSAPKAQIEAGAHPGRAGGDLPRARCWRIPARHRCSLEPPPIDREPGGGPQRRAPGIPGHGS